MEAKHWFQSKMLWVNAIALVAIIVQYATGQEVLDIEAQATILAVINLILRLITNRPIGW